LHGNMAEPTDAGDHDGAARLGTGLLQSFVGRNSSRLDRRTQVAP
jgi:hypothetical protein